MTVAENTRKAIGVIRADQTGALRQPDWLREVYSAYRRREVSDAEVRQAQERAVTAVIAQQELLGLPVVTDGELCRIGGFQESFGGAVTGFDAIPYRDAPAPQAVAKATVDRAVRVESGKSGPGPAILNRLPVKERLKLVRNTIFEEYVFAASVATTPVKVTLIGPDRISQRFEYESSRAVYADMDEFLNDVIAIQRAMIATVVAAGCRYVQIDEPGFTAYVDPVLTEKMRARGEDPQENLARSIRANNAIIEGFPEVTFGVHICRGGGGGRGGAAFHREGPYDSIAEQLFSEANFDRFLLEYDGDHAGTFEPLRFLPQGKTAVLGLVSNHGEAESKDYVLRRLDAATRYASIDQLALCPRCGMGGIHSERAQWDKLQLIRDVAVETWGSAATR